MRKGLFDLVYKEIHLNESQPNLSTTTEKIVTIYGIKNTDTPSRELTEFLIWADGKFAWKSSYNFKPLTEGL